MSLLKNQVTSLVKRGAFDEALALARAATEQSPGSPDAWGVLSHAHEISGDIEAAILAADQAVKLAPNEPAYWFQRGWLHLLVDATQEALVDMRKVLELGQTFENDYYAETAAFLAAQALWRLHAYKDAMHQCAGVRDDFCVYLGMPLSKDSLMKACVRAIRHADLQAA